MQIYSKKNVYEKAMERIEWVFREFKGHVICTSSGGKDSTVVFEMAIDVMNKLKKEKFLKPDYKLKVFWLDQEAEWTKTREYIERKIKRTDVEMYWIQAEFDLTHSASMSDDYNMLRVYDNNYNGELCQPFSELAYDKLYIDEKGKPLNIKEVNKLRKLVNGKWVHDKKLKWKEHNKKDFYVIFDDVYSWISNGEAYAVLQGLKASESPRRNLQVRYQLGYKGITWSSLSGLNKEIVRFSPIYDWSRTDNFIFFNRTKCDYNKLYDDFLSFGISPSNMRVSSLIHETSVAHNSTIVQELDRELYNRMCNRLPGISTYSQLQDKMQKVELPPNFKNYEEFGRYLIDKVLTEKNKHYFLSMYESKHYNQWKNNPSLKIRMDKTIVESILTKDVDKTKWKNAITVIDNEIKKEKKYG